MNKSNEISVIWNRTSTTLRGVAIFWKNDQPGGIGLVLLETPESNLGAFLGKIIEDCENAWRSDPDHAGSAKFFIEQLEDWAKSGEWKTDSGLSGVIFGNVYLLTKYGYMSNDEFNGIVYQYRAEK